MNTASYERETPASAGKLPASRKKNELNELDRRRQQKLITWYELMRSLGKTYTLTRISEKYGFTRGRASQILHGHDALTVQWMLIWAKEFGASPIEIWEDDWEFPELTPASASYLSGLVRTLVKLPRHQRQSVLRILKRGVKPPG